MWTQAKSLALAGPAAIIAISVIVAAAACGCGLSLGQGTLDDPTPSGSIVAQGSLAGENGRSVSGVASVWEQIGGSSCTYVLRLENLSAPSDSTLEVVPLVNGAPGLSPSFATLRSSSGTQNYTFTGVPCGSTWTQISIINPSVANTSTQIEGLATLQAP